MLTKTEQINYVVRLCRYNWSDDALMEGVDTPQELQDVLLLALCDDCGNLPNGDYCALDNVEEVFYLLKSAIKTKQ